jgi:hypothetical protein
MRAQKPDHTESRERVASGARRREQGPDPRSQSRDSLGRARGQLTYDFAIGISIFLLSLAFVFVFVPGMLEPFDAGTQADTPAVNRVADDLTQRRLGNASRPYVLNGTCTREFFQLGTAAPAQCAYSGTKLNERVGIFGGTPITVTIRMDGDDASPDEDVVCWHADDDDDGDARFGERNDMGGDCDPSGSPDVLLSAGSNPAGSGGKSVTATRVALLKGKDVTVEVVMS